MSNEKLRQGLAATIITSGLVLAASATPHDQAIETIWRVQQLQFDYHSAHTAYSCDTLEEKIRSILRAVGAHESVAVEARCHGAEPLLSVRASLSIATPVEATEENILAATRFEPYQLIAARLRGVALPTAADIERFPASWQSVSLSGLKLERGDCDLLNDLRGQIFPRLRIRNATGFGCSVASTRLRPAPKVEALIPARIVRDTEIVSLQ